MRLPIASRISRSGLRIQAGFRVSRTRRPYWRPSPPRSLSSKASSSSIRRGPLWLTMSAASSSARPSSTKSTGLPSIPTSRAIRRHCKQWFGSAPCSTRCGPCGARRVSRAAAVLRELERSADLDPLDYIGFAPQDSRAQFSYGSEHINHGAAAAALISAREALERTANILTGPWDRYLARGNLQVRLPAIGRQHKNDAAELASLGLVNRDRVSELDIRLPIF